MVYVDVRKFSLELRSDMWTKNLMCKRSSHALWQARRHTKTISQSSQSLYRHLKLRSWVQRFPAWPTFEGDRNKTTLLFFNIVSLYFNTLFNWYINLTTDDTIYPSQHFPFGTAFVWQAGNFWILQRTFFTNPPPSICNFHRIACWDGRLSCSWPMLWLMCQWQYYQSWKHLLPRHEFEMPYQGTNFVRLAVVGWLWPHCTDMAVLS